jgi:hypothetical protein
MAERAASIPATNNLKITTGANRGLHQGSGCGSAPFDGVDDFFAFQADRSWNPAIYLAWFVLISLAAATAGGFGWRVATSETRNG